MFKYLLLKTIFDLSDVDIVERSRYGYDVASSSGLLGMQMQGAMAMFIVNIKRIIKLID